MVPDYDDAPPTTPPGHNGSQGGGEQGDFDPAVLSDMLRVLASKFAALEKSHAYVAEEVQAAADIALETGRRVSRMMREYVLLRSDIDNLVQKMDGMVQAQRQMFGAVMEVKRMLEERA